MVEARKKACDAQHPKWVVRESGRYVCQFFCVEIRDTTNKVNKIAILITRDSINREVSALKIFLKTDVYVCINNEAFVASARFRLGSG